MLVKHKLQQLHKLVYQDQGVTRDYDYEHFSEKDVGWHDLGNLSILPIACYC